MALWGLSPLSSLPLLLLFPLYWSWLAVVFVRARGLKLWSPSIGLGDGSMSSPSSFTRYREREKKVKHARTHSDISQTWFRVRWQPWQQSQLVSVFLAREWVSEGWTGALFFLNFSLLCYLNVKDISPSLLPLRISIPRGKKNLLPLPSYETWVAFTRVRICVRSICAHTCEGRRSPHL